MITKHLSNNLNLLMAKARVNSSELARLTGLPATTIKRIRNNEQSNPTVATLLPIAKYFSVALGDLLGGEFAEPLPSGYSVREGVTLLPLLSWQNCTLSDVESSQNKILTERVLSKHAFALEVEERDLDVFPVHSILIVEPGITPASGDYVIVTKSPQSIASIKKYVVETDQVYLKSLVPGLGIVQLTEDYQILGVIVQYKVELK